MNQSLFGLFLIRFWLKKNLFQVVFLPPGPSLFCLDKQESMEKNKSLYSMIHLDNSYQSWVVKAKTQSSSNERQHIESTFSTDVTGLSCLQMIISNFLWKNQNVWTFSKISLCLVFRRILRIVCCSRYFGFFLFVRSIDSSNDKKLIISSTLILYPLALLSDQDLMWK